MSKNMIHRKSLAIGAGLSLALTGLVAAPASAQAVLLTAPDAGSSLNGVISATKDSNVFVLATTMSPSLDSAGETALEYRIQNPSGATLFIKTANDGDPASLSTETSALVEYGTATSATEIDTNTYRETDLLLDPTAAGEATADNLLGINVVGATSATQVTVTAFLNQVDVDGNAIDGVETVGEPVTITFLPTTDLTWSTSFTPVSAAKSLTATATSVPAINGNYFDGNLDMDFTRQGSTATVSKDLVWDNVNKWWDDEGTPISLDSDQEWIGMYNQAGLSFSSQTDSDGFATFVVDRENFVATGDIVRIVSALAPASLSTARIAVKGNFGTSTFEVDRSSLTVTDDVTRAADTGHIAVLERKLTGNVVIASDKRTATFTTLAAHGLSTGDLVNIDSGNGTTLDASRAAVTAVPSSTSFKIAYTADQTVGTLAEDGFMEYVSAFEVEAGTYTAQLQLGDVDAATAAESGTLTPVSASTTIATTPSATVQQARDDNADGTYDTIRVKAGTTSVDVVATVLNSAGAAIGSGRNVQVTVLTATGTAKVNATATAGQILTTDANGQVSLTVTSTVGATNDQVVVRLVPEGVSAAQANFTIDWVAQAFSVYDLNTTGASALPDGGSDSGTDVTRTVLEDGSTTMRLSVLDQWYQAPDAGDYRFKVTGQGVADGFYNLTNGEASVTIADDDTFTSYAADIQLQKLTGGAYASSGNIIDVTMNTVAAGKVMVGADGSTLYTSSTADLSDVVSLKALVEKDDRLQNIAKPVYGNDLVVTGQIVNNATLAGLNGAPVTITGPSNILFENSGVASRGSITFMTESDGDFAVTLYSTTAQTATELTITSLGATNTVDVTFTGQTAGEGTVLTVDAPSFVSSASSFQATVNLSDELGNGVSTGTDNTIKITRTGPGIAFGTLPTNTDANGNASFSILLGANDSGTITITASYDQNNDGDYTDAKDLIETKTITIGEAPAAQKVNAGSFKGYVAVYARGYEGQRLSAKIGNDWVIVDPIVNNQGDDLHRTTDFTGAGVDIAVRIYIDRVLVDTINLTTK